MILAMFVIGGYFYFRRAPKPTHGQGNDSARRFRQHTGDPIFDGILRQGLAIQLDN